VEKRGPSDKAALRGTTSWGTQEMRHTRQTTIQKKTSTAALRASSTRSTDRLWQPRWPTQQKKQSLVEGANLIAGGSNQSFNSRNSGLSRSIEIESLPQYTVHSRYNYK